MDPLWEGELMNPWTTVRVGGGLLVAMLYLCPVHAGVAYISLQPESAPASFAADEVAAALREKKFKVARANGGVDVLRTRDELVRVYFLPLALAESGASKNRLIQTPPESLAPEGFSLRHASQSASHNFFIYSGDPGGAMYGGLELAEQIRTRGVDGVVDTDRNPYMAMRGTKFNIPLDLRTPSYTDMSDSAQANIATVWDFDFWRAYLDALARDRYNYVALWNLHPFPSMVRVPEYPDVALKDVWRSKIRFAEDYDTNATGLVTPAMLADKEIVRHLTIEQKIDFWRRVMSYAKDRNIDFYVVTWNIFTYGVDGKYGITDAIDNPKTVDYFRASVREMFRTYPLLARHRSHHRREHGRDASFEAKEKWAFDTYGAGVLDAARAEPQRQFRLIHRQHQSRAPDIAATFAPLTRQPNVDFVFSFKYAQAHVLSSTTQTFHRGYLESLGDLKTLWTLRNDDALLFRWAAPDFVREFMKNIPYEKSQGYYYGSDMWVWGREFLSRESPAPRQLEIDKHWLHFLLWGRLGYDPSLDNERIAALIEQRFPGVDGRKLFSRLAGRVDDLPAGHGFSLGGLRFPVVHRGLPQPSGPGAHRERLSQRGNVHHPARASRHRQHSDTGVRRERGARRAAGGNHAAAGGGSHRCARGRSARRVSPRCRAGRRRARILQRTLEDIRAMALLGKYYAAKIRGATAARIVPSQPVARVPGGRRARTHARRRAVARVHDAHAGAVSKSAVDESCGPRRLE